MKSNNKQHTNANTSLYKQLTNENAMSIMRHIVNKFVEIISILFGQFIKILIIFI